MKHLSLLTGLYFFASITLCIHAQSSDVTFKAQIEDADGDAVPRAYVKIFDPTESHAVDSLFADDQGYVDRQLPFSYTTEPSSVHSSQRNDKMTGKIYPNIIHGDQTAYLKYNLPGKAELYFMDMHGKKHPNGSKLAPGIYMYHLVFEDGTRSEGRKLMVTTTSQVNVQIMAEHENNGHPNPLNPVKSSHDPGEFYVQLIKDSYISAWDTVRIDSNEINRTYQLEAADVPTAAFSVSGNMETGKPVLFDATASTPANGENLVYTWDFGNGKKGQSIAIPHIYNTEEDYDVQLTVTGEYGASHSVTKTISIGTGETPTSNNGVVTGYVTGQNQTNLSGASITWVEGEAEATTDDDGKAELSNLPVGVPVHFKVTKPGYVAQVVEITIPDTEQKGHFFTVLKQRNPSKTLTNAEFGGEVKGTDGTTVELPVESLVKPDGSVATGDVSISVTPVEVAFEASAFPGTFSAYNSSGENGALLSYGVSEYHFEQGNEELQLADGKKATILIPIYTAGAAIGDEIPLWSVNDDNGEWVQEGMGTVVASPDSPTGLAMEAEVGHFSWWNCDDFDDWNEDNRTGHCERTECTAGFCNTVPVGCWTSGAPDGTNLSSIKPALKATNARAEIQPVFQVRTYLPEDGKDLIFPANNDVYLEARGFGPNGELLKGSYNVLASDTSPEFSIELVPVNAGDTINLALNDTVENYLEPDEILHYKVNIPERKLYKIYVDEGATPSLNGLYSAKEPGSVITSGSIDGGTYNIIADTGHIIITVTGVDESAEGNFKLSVDESTSPIPIALNDSIYDSLSVDNDILLYGLTPTENTVLVSRFYHPQGSGTSGEVSLLSPRGKEIDNESITDDENIITSSLSKDSTYYLLVERITQDGHFVLLTEEDASSNVAYGDTIEESLTYEKDVNLYYFEGQQDDFVTIRGRLPVLDLSGGIFKLKGTDGQELASNSLEYNEKEIVQRLPENGTYAIEVLSSYEDTGSYEVILEKDTLQHLDYDALTVQEVEHNKEHYMEVEIPENRLTHFSIVSNTDFGNYKLLSDNGKEVFTNTTYRGYYNESYTDTFPGGTYYLKAMNEESDTLFVNVIEAISLSFDEKGKATIADTIDQENRVNVYRFTGSPDDAVHGIIKDDGSGVFPLAMETEFQRLSAKGFSMTMNNAAGLGAESLDSTRLYEVAGNLHGNENDTWSVAVYAESTGPYAFDFHHLEPAGDITVDDDFAEYPDAYTSSAVAAGLAIENSGQLTLANGEYPSYLPVKIEADSVDLTGQDRESTIIQNVHARAAIRFNSTGGTLQNLRVQAGDDNTLLINLGSDGIRMEHIDIEPLSGYSRVASTISGNGDNLGIRNVSIDSSSQSGIDVYSSGLRVENCTINTAYVAIECNGGDVTIKNNVITVNENPRAIDINSAQGEGGHVIDSNTIKVNYTNSTPSSGSIYIQENGETTDTNTTYIRSNDVETNGEYFGLISEVGNPPSTVIIENNHVSGDGAIGGKALYLQAGRTDGTSSILVRNNVFDGLSAYESVEIFGVDLLAENERFNLYNNSFRMAAGAEQNTDMNLMLVRGQYNTFEDTSSLYIANNIFEGNGFSYWVDFQSDFAFYSDYNTIYNFSKYKDTNGTLIGTSNDLTSDPMFIDDELHVDTGSPVIDQGAAPAEFDGIPTLDIEGTTRPQGAGYDMGAYETE